MLIMAHRRCWIVGEKPNSCSSLCINMANTAPNSQYQYRTEPIRKNGNLLSGRQSSFARSASKNHFVGSAFAITKDRREVSGLNRRPLAPSAAASFCSSLFMPFVTRLLFVTTPFLVSAGSWPAALSGCKSACTCRISSVKLWAHWSSLWMDACRICNSLQLISFRPVRRDRRA